ncbi:hypothetical protein KUW19_00575 [Ferrimonas balearica]|uniref:phage integrase central domain-containing protein n=1 Tax=Ferrimonas balearica TaxID=44012 RepID=UPI001C9858C4|nr:hypothetical protein [Ferrimonas balearica]MBY6104970.1 hypothetical protein [Ferrimonas balearica]
MSNVKFRITREQRPTAEPGALGSISVKGDNYYWRLDNRSKNHFLGKVGMTREEMYEAYYALMAGLDDKVTLAGLFRRWIEEAEKPENEGSYSPDTVADTANYIGKVKAQFGDRSVESIEHVEMVEWLKHLRNDVSYYVAKNARAYCQTVLGWAQDTGLIKHNPAANLRPIKVTKAVTERRKERKAKVLTWEEFDYAFERAKPALKIAMLLGGLCGMRIADCAKVQMSDLGELGIEVEQSKTGVAQIKQWNPRLKTILHWRDQQKLAKSARTALHRDRVGKEYRKMRVNLRELYDAGVEFESLIFNEQGRAYTKDSLIRMLSDLRAELREEGFDLWWGTHEHKRLFATTYGVEVGGDLEKIKAATGNSDERVLRECYVRGIPVVPTITGQSNQAAFMQQSYGENVTFVANWH